MAWTLRVPDARPVLNARCPNADQSPRIYSTHGTKHEFSGARSARDRLRFDYKRRQTRVNRPSNSSSTHQFVVGDRKNDDRGARGRVFAFLGTPSKSHVTSGFPPNDLPDEARGHFSIREFWIVSSSRCSTKCQETSLTTIFTNVFANALRLVPESIGNGPRFGNVLSA